MTTTYESTPPLSLAEAEEDQRATREWHALNAYITDGALRQWVLCYQDTDQPIRKGTMAYDFRGRVDTIVGGRAPRKPWSTGRVECADGAEFYPSVFGMQWVLRTE